MQRIIVSVIAAALLWPGEPHFTGAQIIGIPTAPYYTIGGQYSLSDVKGIVVDSQYASTVDTQGSTLIPPTLQEFATTFAGDLQSVVGLNLSVTTGSQGIADSIFLTVGDPKNYLDAAGRETSEGYSLSVNSTGITITGASPLGVWWGTRTVLQQAILNNGSIPQGSGVDSPGWATRGMMLDAGRHFYPKDFLVEMCSYMSFFKQNTFHLHLSDNLFNSPFYTRGRSLELYARFRLWSDAEAVGGLNNYKNESFTREDFDHIQTKCAARGVTILPELESPGHALVISQWKPQLGTQEDLSVLNISYPDTIPTMKTIWGTFLDWFHTKVVSIGADEYPGLPTDYDTFVNAMDGFIGETSNKSIRIWGTYPPQYYTPEYNNVYQNVSIQHWEFTEDNPYSQYIKNNYSVVNSNDNFYIVNKFSASYPQTINIGETFRGSPSNGPWYPYIFSQYTATDNPRANNPLVLGAIAPLWNDYGPNASVYSEAFYAWRDGIPALADKQWGGNLTESEYNKYFPVLYPQIPDQNLDRSIPSNSTTIFNYSFQDLDPSSPSPLRLVDTSLNGYDAHTDCAVSTSNSTLEVNSNCTLTTPLTSKGRDYSLTMSIKITSLDNPTNATLISGRDSTLMLTPNITLFASGNYYRLNTGLAMNEWTNLTILGKGNQTFAVTSTADGKVSTREEFQTKMGINGEAFHYAVMAIEAPLRQIGGSDCGWQGQIGAMSLSSQAE